MYVTYKKKVNALRISYFVSDAMTTFPAVDRNKWNKKMIAFLDK